MMEQKKQYMQPLTKWLMAEEETLLAGSVNSDGEPIGNDPTPGTGDDQAARSNPFGDEDWDSGDGVWDE